MEREELNLTIRGELDHMPQGPPGSPQREFRELYHSLRARELNANAATPRIQSLEEAIITIEERYADFVATYDRPHFNL